MTKGKIILSAAVAVAAVGGAFATKANSKFTVSKPVYTYSNGITYVATGCYLVGTALTPKCLTIPALSTNFYTYVTGVYRVYTPANDFKSYTVHQ